MHPFVSFQVFMAIADQLIVFVWFLRHMVDMSSRFRRTYSLHPQDDRIRFTQTPKWLRRSERVSYMGKMEEIGKSELSFCPSHSSDWPDLLHPSHTTDTFAYSQTPQHPCEPHSVIPKMEAVYSSKTSQHSTTT